MSFTVSIPNGVDGAVGVLATCPTFDEAWAHARSLVRLLHHVITIEGEGLTHTVTTEISEGNADPVFAAEVEECLKR